MLPCPFWLKINAMDETQILYQYVATSDPYAVRAICNKYGYSLANISPDDDAALAACLQQVVMENGQSALLDIVAIHPDKDLILEANNVTTAAASGTAAKTPCGCQDKEKSAMAQYLPADPSASNSMTSQGNLFLLAAALILAVAIISKP